MRLEKLENIASIQIGKTPKRAETKYWGKGHPWVSISDLKEHIIISTKEEITDLAVKECGCKMIPKDTLLMSFKLSIGKLAFAGTNLFTNEAICGLQIKNPKQVDPKYLYYALKNTKLIGSNVAVKGATLNTASLKALRVPLAEDISTQSHIANILSKAENLIAQRKKSIALLDEFLKSTFLEMFYTNRDIQDWTKVRVEELAEKKKGSMRTGPFGSNLLHSEFTETGDVKVLGIDNVVKNTFDWKRSRCITFKKFEKLRRYQVFPGDVLISIMATLGRTAVVPKNIPITINSKHLAAVTLDKKIANPYFVAYAFHSHPVILKQLTNNVKGAIMDGLNLTIIKKVRIHLPPIQLQEKFNEIYNQVKSVKNQYQQSLQELENLYGGLSHRAFKGELASSRPVKQQANISDKALLAFYQKQIIGHVIKKHQEHRMEQGEMILAKDLYHLEALYGIKTHFQFKNWHYGTYDNKIRQLINGKDKFFAKKSVGQKGFQVLALGEKSEALFAHKYVKPELEHIDKAMDELLQLYASFPIKQRSYKIELLNTVCKSIVDAQSTELVKVREVMKQWKTTKAGFKNKAEKFSEQETDEMIELIISKGWNNKLLQEAHS